MSLENYIKERLKDTKRHCDFKRQFIPEGWVVIKIDTFSKELAKNITKKYRKDI